MLVEDLIKLLLKQDGKARALLSRDAEGNTYSPVEDLEEGSYAMISGWEAEFYHTEEERIEQGSKGEKAICLFPIN